MTTYTTSDYNYSHHPVHTELKEIKEFLIQAKGVVFNDDSGEKLQRINSIIKYLDQSLKKTKPVLISGSILTNIQPALALVKKHLNQFVATPNIASLEAANRTIDELLKEIPFIFAPSLLTDVQDIEVLVSRTKNEVDNLSKEINTRIVSLEKDTEKLEKTIEAQKGRLDSAIDQFNQDYNKSSEKWAALLHQYDKELETAANVLPQRIENISDKYVTQLEELKTRAEEIVQIISGIGITGEYQNAANRAEMISYFWQLINAVLMGGLVYFGYITAEMTIQAETSWMQLLPKIVLISVTGIAVKYSISQVQYYQSIEQKNRKIQLELKALDPYLAVFEKDKANGLREKLAENYFVGQKEHCRQEDRGLGLEHWGKAIYDLIKDIFKRDQPKL